MNLRHRFRRRIGDLCVPPDPGRRDEPSREQNVGNEALPLLPVIAAWFIHHDDRKKMTFPGLDERQGLVALVHSAETAWKQGDGVRLLDEHELRGEEISAQVHQFGIAGNDRAGMLLERQQ